MIENINTVYYTALFIIPGYILFTSLETLVPISKKTFLNQTLKFITATLLNYLIWFWLIKIIIDNSFYSEKYYLLILFSFIIMVLSPYLLGQIFAIIQKKEIARKIYNKIGFSPINPIPTSWDYVFSNVPSKSWIKVTLTDDNIIYGKFSGNSYAADDETKLDIYIEKVFDVDDEGNWNAVERSNGILIVHNHIKHIEFFSNEEDSNNDEKEQPKKQWWKRQTKKRGK